MLHRFSATSSSTVVKTADDVEAADTIELLEEVGYQTSYVMLAALKVEDLSWILEYGDAGIYFAKKAYQFNAENQQMVFTSLLAFLLYHYQVLKNNVQHATRFTRICATLFSRCTFVAMKMKKHIIHIQLTHVRLIIDQIKLVHLIVSVNGRDA